MSSETLRQVGECDEANLQAIAVRGSLYKERIKWNYRGLQVVCLWQLMEYFQAHKFLEAIREVYSHELQLKRRVEEAGDWDTELPDWENKETNDVLKLVSKAFDPKEFPNISNLTNRVYGFANSKCTYQELYIRVVGLRESMEDELRNRLLILVPDLKRDYCDKTDAFGEDVGKAFPSTDGDIKELNNCYAMGFSTACVFHSMRVLEKGLVSLAKALQVNSMTENWGRMLEGIEGALDKLGKAPAADKPRKLTDLQFYSEAVKEFRYFKDAWRNHVMHACTRYGEQDALKIMEHVRDFMRHLSTRLSE